MLCLDIEGGHGGSSRSLFQVVRHLDRRQVQPEVWCRRAGNVERWYDAIGVSCRVIRDLPVYTPTAVGLRSTVHDLRSALPAFLRAQGSIGRWANEISARADLVHFNHQSFFALAALLRGRTQAAFVTHVRTRPPNSRAARLQARTLLRVCDGLVYITENEQAHVRALTGSAPGTVIYNSPSELRPESVAAVLPDDGRLRVASMSTFSLGRGVDRLVEVAAALKRRGCDTVLFVVMGDVQIPSGIGGPLAHYAGAGGGLAAYARDQGVQEYFAFTGHIAEPEATLLACDVLIKLTRDANPWGRDIIEALAFGKPVITLGTWDVFVRNGESGILHPAYDPDSVASDIATLSADRSACTRLGAMARDHIQRLCSPESAATRLTEVWRTAHTRRQALGLRAA